MSKTKPETGEVWNYIGNGYPGTIIGYKSDGSVVYEVQGSLCNLKVEDFTRLYRLVVPRQIRYVNVYPDTASTRQEADNMAYQEKRIACIKIEHEEGQYDE